jgi:hypothetical protein
MSNPLIHCKLCKTHVDKRLGQCDSCSIKGCVHCIKTVCCDCGAYMCNKCRKDDEILCGCYGKCTDCEMNVNRGDDGWGCSTCNKWLCRSCRYNTVCDECSSNQ